MAVSYNLTIVIPNSTEWDVTRQYVTFFQFGSGSGGFLGTGFSSLLTDTMDHLVGNYGGTYSVTSSDNGTNTTYTISWVNVDIDPVVGEFVSISFQDDAGNYYSGKFESTQTITPCDVCYSIQRPGCQTSYTLELDLTPSTTYTVAFYSNNGNVYTQQVEAGGDGELVIDASAPEFPEGFFIPESGGYTVKIFTDTDLVDVVPFVIGANEYQCIQLSFQYVVTTTSSIQATFEYLIHDVEGDPNYFIIDDIGNNFIV